jgi:hypothetical protein
MVEPLPSQSFVPLILPGILMELYMLDFQVSCQVHYGFDHVDRLVGAVGAVAPPKPAPDTRDAAVYVNVPVSPGS